MIIPETLQNLMKQKQFWSYYLWQDEYNDEEHDSTDPYRAFDDISIEFPISNYSLLLNTCSGFAIINLELQHPDLVEPLEIAWDDQAHWHPDLLRWQELELLCRVAALTDPNLPHPGIAILLLYRFTPFCTNDDLDIIIPIMEAAWRSLNLYFDEEIDNLLEPIDHYIKGCKWQFKESLGWILVEDDDLKIDNGSFYSLRTEDNTRFPFEKLLQMFLAAEQIYYQSVDPQWLSANNGAVKDLAQQIFDRNDLSLLPDLRESLLAANCNHPTILAACNAQLQPACAVWIIELLLSLPLGTLIKRYFQPARPRVKTINISLIVNVFDPDSSDLFHYRFGNSFIENCKAYIKNNNCNWTSTGGITTVYSDDGRCKLISTDITISTNLDLVEAIRQIKEFIKTLVIPKKITIEIVSPQKELIIPFNVQQ